METINKSIGVLYNNNNCSVYVINPQLYVHLENVLDIFFVILFVHIDTNVSNHV